MIDKTQLEKHGSTDFADDAETALGHGFHGFTRIQKQGRGLILGCRLVIALRGRIAPPPVFNPQS